MLRTTLLRSARPAVRSASTSTTENAAAKAKDGLNSTMSKAQELAKTAGDKVGNALGAYREPIVGNAAVARELVKQVYVAEKLSPPSLAQVQQTYTSFFSQASSPNYWLKLVESGEWKKYALYAVEAYGIFKIGEMVGRRHVVGYKLNEPAHPELAH